MSHFVLELTDCFKERLAFDISDGSADFYYCNMHIIGCEITVKTALDLVGNMRDYLYGSSAIISTAFFLQNGPVNLTGCHIGILCQTFVDEALVVTEIQIGFRSIIRYDSFIFKIFVIAILPAPPRMFSLHHPDCSAIYQYRCNTIFPVNCQALPPD